MYTYHCANESDVDYDQDLLGLVTYTLQQCVDVCSSINWRANNTTCKSAILAKNMAQKYADTDHANCWLKIKGDGTNLLTGDAQKLLTAAWLVDWPEKGAT